MELQSYFFDDSYDFTIKRKELNIRIINFLDLCSSK